MAKATARFVGKFDGAMELHVESTSPGSELPYSRVQPPPLPRHMPPGVYDVSEPWAKTLGEFAGHIAETIVFPGISLACHGIVLAWAHCVLRPAFALCRAGVAAERRLGGGPGQPPHALFYWREPPSLPATATVVRELGQRGGSALALVDNQEDEDE